MPTLIFPVNGLEVNPLSLTPTASNCNYLDPTQNQMGTATVGANDILQLATKFRTYMMPKLGGQGSSEELKMVYYSSFRVADILSMISQNLDCGFLRVYSCMDDQGNHLKMMVPIHSSGVIKSTPSAVYLADCCRCRPECG
jgi:hypothetical protein